MASTRVVVRDLIISFPKLFQPDDGPDPKNPRPRYAATLIATKEVQQSESWRQLQDAILLAAEKKFPGKGAAMVKSGKIKTSIRDDGEDKGHPKGSLFFNARSIDPPGVVDRTADPATGKPRVITEDDQVVGGAYEVYSGCIVHASVTPYYYDQAGNKGIAFALNNIQRWADGARLDNRKAAEDEFEGQLSDTPASLDGMDIE